jgi:peptidoglycan/LPS O-acetylase OafA/YrhL
MPAELGYRPDIDGLRAIAVVVVVVFHAFPAVMPGGYVGVDVFFVISGYLISGILFRQLEEKRLNLTTFYARRIRRLFPALATVLSVSLSLGWLILYPEAFRLLGRHAAAGAGFVSNLQLLRETGYFDIFAQSKPLLHLWSLGVEEQFYFGLPLLIVLSGRRLKELRRALPILFVISFFLCLWLSRTTPTTAFYLPVTRFWEFLAGSALAWLTMTRDQRFPSWATWCGLVLLAATALLMDQNRSFPGWWALLPVTGTFLVIGSGPKAWLNRTLLSHPWLVTIGLISYPLYLWHWPLLTFSGLVETGMSPGLTRAIAVLVSGGFAWLTYRYIEQPVRTMSGTATPGLCVAMALIAVAGVTIFVGNGHPERFSRTVKTIGLGAGVAQLTRPDCGISESDKKYMKECREDTRDVPVFALLGDSHADALYPGLVRLSAPGQRWMLIGRQGCAPLTGVSRLPEYRSDERNDASNCAASSRIALDAIDGNQNIKVVLIAIASRMTGELSAKLSFGQTVRFSGAFVDGLSNTINDFEKSGKKVLFLVDNPPLPGPDLCLGLKHGWITRRVSEGCSLGKEQLASEMSGYTSMIRALAARHPRLAVFDPTDLLCEHGSCNSVKDGNSIYSDTDHLSDYGNGLVAQALIPFVTHASPTQERPTSRN